MSVVQTKEQRLLERLEKRLRAGDAPMRVVMPRPESSVVGLCEIERASHCRMIRHLRRCWGFPMQMLIDQACFGLAGLEQMDDRALVELHKDLERAQDCLRDGISFEDAGLIRPRWG